MRRVKRGAGAGKGRDSKDFQRVWKNDQKYVAVCGKGWGWEWGGQHHQKVPDAKEARGSQDSTGMTLAKISNSREVEPEETTSSRQTCPHVEGWGQPLF